MPRPFDHGSTERATRHRSAVQARIESRCSCGCDRDIAPGDWIVPDGEGGWQLLACAESD